MKIWMKWALRAAALCAIGILITAVGLQHKHVRSLQNHVKEQHMVIDSLRNRRMTVMDVQLYVTDKSKNTIYGRYNKGTITMPQEKTYHLEVDSVSIALK